MGEIIPEALSFLTPFPLKKGGICIAQSLKIPHNPKLEDYDKTIQQLLETQHSRAVIIFASEEDIRWGVQHILASSTLLRRVDDLPCLGL